MSLSESLPDVIIYSLVSALLCPVIALSFRSKLIAKNTHLPVLLSCLIVIILIIGDLAVPLYYTITFKEDTAKIRSRDLYKY